MICKFCGNVIEDNSDFCFICGQKNPMDEKAVADSNDVFSQTAEAKESVKAEVKAPAQTIDIQQASDGKTEMKIDEAAFTAPASPDAPVYDATAPIYAQTTPIYAQSAPVYAQQVIIQHVQQTPTITKTKPEKDPSILTKAQRILAVVFAATFLLQFISWIWYDKAAKGGYEKKATELLNLTMTGICIFLGALCLFFIKSFML